MNSTYFNDFIKTAKIKPSKRRIKDDFITLKKIEFWIRALQHSWLFPFPQIYFNAVLKLLSPKVQKEIIDKSFSSFIKERKPIKNSRTNIEEFYRENGCSFSPKSEYIEISDYSSVATIIHSDDASKWSHFIYKALINELISRQKVFNEQDPYYKRIKILKNELHLNNLELNLIIFLWFKQNDILNDIEDGYNELDEFNSMCRKDIIIFKQIFESDQDEIESILHENSPLRKMAVITPEDRLSSAINNFLNGISDIDLNKSFFEIDQGPTLSLDQFPIDKTDIHYIHELLKNYDESHSLNILFYGTEGTGKTELSRSLAKSLDWPLIKIQIANQSNDFKKDYKSSDRFEAISYADYKFRGQKALFLVDEADTILNQSEKGFLNLFMEKIKHPIIWITNNIECIERSTNRRFDYSVEFEKFKKKRRIDVWKSVLKTHNANDLISENTMLEFAEKTEVTAGGITQAIVQAKRLQEGSSFTPEAVIHQVLNAQSKLLNLEFSPMKNKPMSRSYDLNALNINCNMQLVIKSVLGFNECWNKMKEDDPPQSLNILLYGNPGTGKSEFARYVSRLLDRPLITKTASSLLNCYLGETEKSIKNAFDEAAESGSILFFDEADSFLSDRTGAQKQWEITQVNELLMRMEHFKGIFIAATNFNEHLDSACRRRFPIKVGFDYLKSDGIEKMWKIYFPKFDFPVAAARLQALAPGDFNAVYNNIRYLPEEFLSSESILENLEKEIQSKSPLCQGRKMGF